MMIMATFLMMYLYDKSVCPNSIFSKDTLLFLPANANAVATLQTSMTLRPKTTITNLAAEPTHASLHSSPRAFCIPYPATSPLEPRCQTLADKLAHAVYNSVDHRRVAMAHAVYCQGTCHRIQGDHLPPGHTFKRGRERQHSHQWMGAKSAYYREVLRLKSTSSFVREVISFQIEYLKFSLF